MKKSKKNQLNRQIRIIQHNSARSTNAMVSALEYAKDKAELVLFQEPYINRVTFSSTVSHPSFIAIIPTPPNSGQNPNPKPRVLAFVKNNSQIGLKCTPRTDILNDLNAQILGITALGLKDKVLIFNIYNEKDINNV